MSYNNKTRQKQLNNVLIALRNLCQHDSHHTALPPQTQWPKTREVAEHCELTIYLARYYLLRLVENKKAYVTPGSINNSLRWYIAEPSSLSKQEKTGE